MSSAQILHEGLEMEAKDRLKEKLNRDILEMELDLTKYQWICECLEDKITKMKSQLESLRSTRIFISGYGKYESGLLNQVVNNHSFMEGQFIAMASEGRPRAISHAGLFVPMIENGVSVRELASRFDKEFQEAHDIFEIEHIPPKPPTEILERGFRNREERRRMMKKEAKR